MCSWVYNLGWSYQEADEEETQCEDWETGRNRISEQELKKRNDSSQRTLADIFVDILK